MNFDFKDIPEEFRLKEKIKQDSYLVNGKLIKWQGDFSPVYSTISSTNDYKKTLIYCHSTVGKAILNTSITIVFGFSILVLSKFIPTIYFGIFTGIAMMLAMISVLTLLPSLILVIKPFKNN